MMLMRVRMGALIAALLLLPLSVVAEGDSDFLAADIRIDGLERISLASVFRVLPIQPGDRINMSKLQLAARQLFATNQFDDVQFRRDGDILYLLLEERPWIETIEITGNQAVSEDNLLEGLKSAGLSEGEVYRRATAEAVLRELLRQYVSQGRYTANIDVESDPRPQNKVKVRISIDEGKPSKIRRINIIGNKAFTDNELLDRFQLNTGGYFSFLSSANKYSREKLSGDLEALRSFYLNQGYATFRLDSVSVSLDESRGGVYISLVVHEGPIYRVDEITFSGNTPLKKESLESLLIISKGQTYSQRRILALEDIVTRRLNNLGYVFAKVGVVPDFPEDQEGQEDQGGMVKLTVYIDSGKRTYVRRITFVGQEQTLDEVLRREMRQAEGAVASAQLLERSRLRLERSGYLRQVSLATQPVPGTDDQIDVQFDVDEELGGNLSLNLGYSRASGSFYNLSVQQNNFLGSGRRLGISATRSTFRRTVSFNVEEPYFTLDGFSLGYHFAANTLDFDNFNAPGQITDTIDTGFSLGALLNDSQRIQFSFGVEETEISQGTGISNYNIIQQLVDEGNEYLIGKFGVGWSYSTLNRGIFPTGGASQSVTMELGTGDGLDYLQASWRGRFYFPLGRNYTFAWRQRIGYLQPFGGSETPPFLKFFRAGGLSSLRGYDPNSLGPWSWGGNICNSLGSLRESTASNAVTVGCDVGPGDAQYEGQQVREFQLDPGSGQINLAPIGSDILLVGSLELIIPTPLAEGARSLRTVLFVDYGDAYSSSCDSRLYVLERCSRLRLNNFEYHWSSGVALTWITPFGPLNFVFAYAPDAEPWDRVEDFDFSLGNFF